jgi:ABC-type multidrug transport system fused ATPase/permease subunit
LPLPEEPRPAGGIIADLGLVLRYRRHFGRLFVFAVGVLGAVFVQARLTADAINRVQVLITQLDHEPPPLWAPLSIVAALLVGGAILRVLAGVLRTHLNLSLKRRLRAAAIEGIFRQPAAVRAAQGGVTAEVLRSDVEGASSFLIYGLFGCVEAALSAAVYATQLILTVKSGLFVLLAFLLVGGTSQILLGLATRRRERRGFEELHQSMQEAVGRTHRLFDALGELLYFRGERKEGEALVAAWTRVDRRSLSAQTWTSIRTAATEALQHLLLLPMVILFVALRGGKAGDIVAAQTLVLQVSVAFATLIGLPSMMLQYRPQLRRLDEVTSRADLGSVPELMPELAAQAPKLRIELDDVKFAYEGGPPVLSGVTFDVPAGARVGIVGASGSGKSTLARLLVGDYAPSSGRIRIGGVDVTDWPLSRRRRLVTLSVDAPSFLLDTLAANVRFGRTVDGARLDESMRAAGAHEVAAALPAGMDTVVTSASEQLSGGQRKKLALARALLSADTALVLDEPLAQVDVAGQREIARRIAEVTAGRTCIIISHDIDLVPCDFVIYLKAGRVDAVGTHRELAARDPEYRRLTSRED